MAGFGLVVRFVLRPGHSEAFDRLVAETLEGIREFEPGTLVYVSHEPDGAPGVRVFYELYTDRIAFDRHEAQPHTRRFLEARGQHLESFEADFLTALDDGVRRA